MACGSCTIRPMPAGGKEWAEWRGQKDARMSRLKGAEEDRNGYDSG